MYTLNERHIAPKFGRKGPGITEISITTSHPAPADFFCSISAPRRRTQKVSAAFSFATVRSPVKSTLAVQAEASRSLIVVLHPRALLRGLHTSGTQNPPQHSLRPFLQFNAGPKKVLAPTSHSFRVLLSRRSSSFIPFSHCCMSD